MSECIINLFYHAKICRILRVLRGEDVLRWAPLGILDVRMLSVLSRGAGDDRFNGSYTRAGLPVLAQRALEQSPQDCSNGWPIPSRQQKYRGEEEEEELSEGEGEEESEDRRGERRRNAPGEGTRAELALNNAEMK